MREIMIKSSAVLIACLGLSGCSFIVELALFNGSGSEVEVCNLNHDKRPCQVIPDGEVGKIDLIGTKAANSWNYSINDLIYSFVFGTYPEHASNVLCHGVIQRRCAIPVQLESDGRLYWAGKDNELPVSEFPEQPEGFPVEPGA